MIILLFGQPASGKTTLSLELLKSNKFIHIDGDEWRDVTKNKDYSKDGRMVNLKGAFDMALYLERKGYDCLLSFVTPFDTLRNYLSENGREVRQVYLTYNSDRGRNDYFATEFEPPSRGYLHLDTSELSINECLIKISQYVGINFNNQNDFIGKKELTINGTLYNSAIGIESLSIGQGKTAFGHSALTHFTNPQ